MNMTICDGDLASTILAVSWRCQSFRFFSACASVSFHLAFIVFSSCGIMLSIGDGRLSPDFSASRAGAGLSCRIRRRPKG